jgi:2-keto-4-pentenoate hydratase/2-oxohepta-3-ene-1,7-dioic acid hydratase in catechol pathway
MILSRHRLDGTDTWLARLPDGRHQAGPHPDALRDLTEPEAERIAQAPALVPALPTKILCIGLNYRQHAAEMGKPLPEEPVLFHKPITALLPQDGIILLPPGSAEVHWEGELALVIGRTASRIREDQAHHHIQGYTLLNDVTARDIQRRDLRYTRAKGFDTFAPCGPALVAGLNPHELELSTRVNGALRQHTRCDDMIFSIPFLLSWVSHHMTLLPGDILATGTPAGVGAMQPGDLIEVHCPAIGTLRSRVAALPAPTHDPGADPA